MSEQDGSEQDGSEQDGSEQDGMDEVAEFAALLTRLKERTDRSYGQLARRLNMNTSTLHRYCAGETVPLDFAPVERFAVLCGATPEERLELHRLWLLAVEARQRPRTPEPVAEVTVVPVPAPRPWYRRRRILVATAVACALLATLGGVSALSSDRSGPSESSDRVHATDPTGTSASPTSPHSSSPPPERPKGSASPTPGRTSSSSTGARSTTEDPGSPTGSAAPNATVPLTWTVNSHIWNAGCGHDYVIDRPPTEVPPPPTAQDAETWATAEGAVHGHDTNVQISVQGRSSTAVVLEAVRVRVTNRGTPVQGNSYTMDNGCGGALTPRVFSVDLDADRPIARSEPGYDGENPIPAIQMPYKVSSTDPEVLLVTARTKTCGCDWYLELDWSSQGRKGTVRIDNDGQPFRTSSIEGLPRYSYDYTHRTWVTSS